MGQNKERLISSTYYTTYSVRSNGNWDKKKINIICSKYTLRFQSKNKTKHDEIAAIHFSLLASYALSKY